MMHENTTIKFLYPSLMKAAELHQLPHLSFEETPYMELLGVV